MQQRTRMLLLRCPQCKHTMKYQNADATLTGKSKRCVYCGKSYQVKPNIAKQLP